MSSKFELDQFAIQPTAQQLDICRKDNLFAIADLYRIQVARGARKAEIKGVIHEHLIEQGVLPGEREAGVAPEMSASMDEGEEQPKPTEMASIDPATLPSPSNPLLAIRLKELDLELSRQQYQSQLLQVRTVELETQRAIRLKELDLELKSQQPAHFPAAEAPSVNVPVSAPVNASTPSPIPAPRSPFQMGVPPDNSLDVAIGSSHQPTRIKGPPQTPFRGLLCHRVRLCIVFLFCNSTFVYLNILPERTV
ncbi:uncharacterized protein LOC128532621 [Clarias gariepinus]|uniref:uncharacterized protein LOC128532621 n=1 Tax=Clarias gariepinus TaxID=13013 RepID=UPI00234E240A|nr:uncharacterized protein LOC128532621 [Clarias gariepinus]